MQDKKVFNVTEINNIIKGVFDEIPLFNHIYIRGEISNFKSYPSGHRYFTLKDSEGSLRCVLFRGYAESVGFELKDGMSIIACGKLSVYTRDGGYQLVVNSVSEDGIGNLYVAFEQLKQKLDAEGLFDMSHKKELPMYPSTVCIITSSAGAAVHDMIRIMHQRHPGVEIVILPVRVQGEEAPFEIANAIAYANQYKVADVIITGRGGGSIEDLWAFNTEVVARAIYASYIPVISAVGHEPDVTISDYVADRRASTPSNAAEIVVPNTTDLLISLQKRMMEISQLVQRKISDSRQNLDRLAKSNALTDPLFAIHENQIRVDGIYQQLEMLLMKRIEAIRLDFNRVVGVLDAVSPLKVLSRGYAIATNSDHIVISDKDDVSVGDLIDVQLHKGILNCRIEGKSNNG